VHSFPALARAARAGDGFDDTPLSLLAAQRLVLAGAGSMAALEEEEAALNPTILAAERERANSLIPDIVPLALAHCMSLPFALLFPPVFKSAHGFGANVCCDCGGGGVVSASDLPSRRWRHAWAGLIREALPRDSAALRTRWAERQTRTRKLAAALNAHAKTRALKTFKGTARFDALWLE
jgi:hypothetical protein